MPVVSGDSLSPEAVLVLAEEEPEVPEEATGTAVFVSYWLMTALCTAFSISSKSTSFAALPVMMKTSFRVERIL